MPHIRKLSVHTARNITSLKINNLGACNVFIGNNGAGKTTLLESVFILSVGKGVRAQRPASLIQYHAPHMVIRAEIIASDSALEADPIVTLAMETSHTGKALLKRNAEIVSRAGVATEIPVQWLGPESFKLWLEGPSVRRSFLDWGVFHVEPEFGKWHRKYQRALQHRNALLKQRVSSLVLQPWEQLLAEYGEKIAQARAQYLAALTPFWEHAWQGLGVKAPIEQMLEQGWSGPHSLREAFERSRPQDFRLGVTTIGPHRATWDAISHGVPVSQSLSRGQLKRLIVAMFIAQAKHLAAATGKYSILLCDDLLSELDLRAQILVWEALVCLPNQLWITSITPDFFINRVSKDTSWFHVEQGALVATEMFHVEPQF